MYLAYVCICSGLRFFLSIDVFFGSFSLNGHTFLMKCSKNDETTNYWNETVYKVAARSGAEYFNEIIDAVKPLITGNTMQWKHPK